MRLENKVAAGAVAALALIAVLQLGLQRLQARAAHAAVEPPAPASLIIPVQGVATLDLADTWGAARAKGRSHQGIDILAPARTPVLAAQDGVIARFFDSERGGITIYEYDRSGRFVFYYAHLSAREAGLREGDRVRQGQVIGYVGETGNATTPHLHFEIQRLGPEHKWWRAQAINPYPWLIDEHMPREQAQ
ncbi:MAG TPA: M23 family metallopeptidase [Caulobacterales bacterium]|nr:M23 family metallopeptidase [Caulobacterales bacterium]